MSQQVQAAAQKQKNTRVARGAVWCAGVVNMALLVMMCATASDGSAVPMLLLALLLDVVVGAYALSQGLLFELIIESKWKKTCIGLGGNFVGEGRRKFHTKLAFDPLTSIQKGEWKRDKICPKIRDVRGSWNSWSAIVYPFYGQNISDYTQKADRFAMSFRVPSVSFDLADNGLIAIRAGQLPVPDAYEFTGHLQASQANTNQPSLQQAVQSPQTLQTQFNQPVSKQVLSIEEVPTSVLQAADNLANTGGKLAAPLVYAQTQRDVANVWAAELELLKAVPMARDMQGRVCKIPIASNHWFIAAKTGNGKSSWIWGLVLGLIPAWKLGLVKFWGIDSKWCELGFELGWWEHYASKDAECVELLEAAVVEMQARLKNMQGISRRFTASVQTPLNVVVIDEMAYLTAYQADRKLRERAQAAISALLSAGRAPGFAVVSAVQDPRKEVSGFRDLYSIRISGSLPAPMVDLVLGEGMYDLGARCDLIPMGDAGAGAAYVISERTLKPMFVRAPFCSDQAIKQAYQNAVRRAVGTDQLKTDDLSLQSGWTTQPVQQQWQYRVD